MSKIWYFLVPAFLGAGLADPNLVGPVADAGHSFGKISDAILKFFLTDNAHVTSTLAVLLILEEHLRQFYKKEWRYGDIFAHPSGILRKVGVDVLILDLYYCTGELPWISKRPFVLAVSLVFLDTFVLYYMVLFVAESFTKGPCTAIRDIWNTKDRVDYSIDPYTPKKGDNSAATSKYTQIAFEFRKVLPIFFAQMGLISFFMFYLNGDSDTHDRSKVTYGYWVVAILLQLYAGEQQLGDPYDPAYWKLLREEEDLHIKDPMLEISNDSDETAKKRANKEKEYLEGGGVEFSEGDHAFTSAWVQNQMHHVYFVFPVPFWVEWRMRQFMDMVINRLFRTIIIYTFPIMLCVEAPLDFVKDCTAIWFITTLDDLVETEQKSISEMLVLLRKRIAWDENVKKQHRSLAGNVREILLRT